MKALTWKAVFATLNPSPVFEVVAIFGEELAINGNGLDPNKTRTAVVRDTQNSRVYWYSRRISEPR
jgi:hypothetical protein